MSSLGKGLTASSLGALLSSRGLRVTMQKLDPYLNVDPGTMNPFQHGEVFVTEDGAETDLDVGHYERFLDIDLAGRANVTTGQVYSERDRPGAARRVPRRHRAGHPAHHQRDQVADHGRRRGRPGATVDVVITEIGGTVGDIESLPFLEAARQVRHEIGRDNCFFLHISLVPYIAPSGELKTKPTQHSVAALRSIGIQPDALVCRSDREIGTGLKRKISLMCDVDEEGVISCADAPSIYDIPKVLHREGLDAYVVRRLGLPFRDVDWTVWGDLLDRVHAPKQTVEIALVGKYIDLPDAYLSVTEALRAGGFAHHSRVKIRWVQSDECQTPEGAAPRWPASTASACPAGSASAASRASSARSATPASTASRPSACAWACSAWSSSTPATSPGWRRRTRPSSTRRRPTPSSPPWPASSTSSPASGTSAAPCGWAATRPTLQPGSVAAAAYGSTEITERHRHRYEVANAYRDRLQRGGHGLLRHLARRAAGGVRGAAGRRAPVLRRDAGPPGAQEPPDPPAPAVRRVRPGRGATTRSPRRLPVPTPSESAETDRQARAGRTAEPARTSPRVLLARETVYEGRVISLERDTVAMPGGGDSVRELVRHPGAVAVVAVDDEDRVVLVRQYRHPSASTCGSSRPGCATPTASRRWRRRSGSWPRRRCCPPRAGRC